MSVVVNNNVSAFSAFTNLTANMNGMKKSMARLSTGVKAVSDDPSGIGISERMRSQARSTAMARHNVDNGLSLLQTADSWMQKINDMLGRMHELSIEAGDGTKTAADQTNIQTEFAQLQDEITRITSKSTAAAKFNGLYLFRGGTGNAVAAGDAVESGNMVLQVGADVDQELTLTLADLQVTNTNAVGTITTYTYDSNSQSLVASAQASISWASVIDQYGGVSATSTDVAGKLQKAIDHVANNRATIGAQQNRLEHTRSGLLAYEDNLRAAESKIRDVDVAQESTNFAKFQILNQVSNAMLAQANQLPQAALQLIG